MMCYEFRLCGEYVISVLLSDADRRVVGESRFRKGSWEY